jgi:nucleoid-associated protein EbfC
MNEGLDVEGEVERLMADVRDQQRHIETVQKEIAATQIKGMAERGLVTVSMNGGGRFTDVTVEPDALRQFDAHLLGQVVLEAIHDGMRQLAALNRERFGPLMDDPEALDAAMTYWSPEDSPNTPQPR